MKWPGLKFKRIAWPLGSFLFLCVILVVHFIASEWTYIRRMRNHPANSILDVAWYQPKEAVAGSREPPPAVGVEINHDPSAFEEAVRLAESKNTAALLVI